MAESAPLAQGEDALRAQVLDLQDQLTRERRKSSGYAAELRAVKEQSLAIQKQIEVEQEEVTNKLMRRLAELKHEKQKLAVEVELEEELISNTLQKRLAKLNAEKTELEKQLEAEQEFVQGKLQKKLEELRSEQTRLSREKIELENQLEAEQEYVTNRLQKQLSRLAQEKQLLQLEKSDLQKQVSDLAASADRLRTEQVVRMRQAMECEEENITNRLQSQIEALLANYKALESGLEARGISVKDIVTPNIDKTTDWVYGRSPTKLDCRSSGLGSRQSRSFSQSSSTNLSPESSFTRPSGNSLQRASVDRAVSGAVSGASPRAVGVAL